ncbi:MAG: hypothetical protein R2867_06235 [Caldilineaceae bacterium]
MIAIPLQATQPVPSPSAASGREKLVLGEPAPQTFVDVPTTLRSLTFEPVVDGSSAVADEWQLISGRWVAEDGMYRQLEVDGSDYISLLNLPKQRHYSMEVRLRMNGARWVAVLSIMPPPWIAAGAHVIDMDERGRYLRWGYYNEEGRYTLEGGVPLATGLADGQWHRLRLLTHGDVSTIWFDDQELSRQENHSAEGYLGLVTSRSQIDFDDLVVMALPATTDVAPDKIGAPSVIPIVAAAVADLVETEAIFYDDFAEDNRKSWQVLDGTWQFLDGVYLQTDLDGLERGTVSTFQGNNYRATVSMRLIDGSMGAGLYFNMAQRGRKTQSQLIRFHDNGNNLQWGAFDEGGNFVLQGSTMIANGDDGNWHTVAVEVANGKAAFAVDNVVVARNISLTYSSGYLGLFTSAGQVAFDNLVVVALADKPQADEEGP